MTDWQPQVGDVVAVRTRVREVEPRTAQQIADTIYVRSPYISPSVGLWPGEITPWRSAEEIAALEEVVELARDVVAGQPCRLYDALARLDAVRSEGGAQ